MTPAARAHEVEQPPVGPGGVHQSNEREVDGHRDPSPPVPSSSLLHPIDDVAGLPTVTLRSPRSRTASSASAGAQELSAVSRHRCVDARLLLILDAEATVLMATDEARLMLARGSSRTVAGERLDTIVELMVRSGDSEIPLHQALWNACTAGPQSVEFSLFGDNPEVVNGLVEALKSMDGCARFSVTLSHGREPDVADVSALDWELATTRCMAEIGAAVVDEATLGGFLKRCARAFRTEAGSSAARIGAVIHAVETGFAGGITSYAAEYPEPAPGEQRSVTFVASIGVEPRVVTVALLDSIPGDGVKRFVERWLPRLAAAVAKRVAEDRMLKVAAQFTAFDAVASDLADANREPVALAKIVAERVGGGAGTACLIELFDPTTGRVECRVSHGSDDALVVDLIAYLTRALDDDAMLYASSDQHSPLAGLSTHDARASFSLSRLRGAGLDVGSALSVPVRGHGATIGWIAVCRRDGARTPIQDEQLLLRAVADRLGASVVNATLLRENRLHVERLAERVQERTSALELAIDDLSSAQEELVRTEKLSSLGAMVAGIAHELNTPIGNAVMVASTLESTLREFRERISSGTVTKREFDAFVAANEAGAHILVACLGAARDLIASFKQVAADQTSEQRRTFELASSVRDAIEIIRPSIARSVACVTFHAEDSIAMDSYPGAVGRVVTNLIQNAVLHAFDGRDHGTIDVSIGHDGEYLARIEVRDDGGGISAEDLPHVFDAFYTTKLGRGGSGLGLQIVFNLVSTVLHGKIDVCSERGVGTCFTVVIPRVAPSALSVTGES